MKCQQTHQINLAYPAKVKPDHGGFVVTFRDLPNVFTEGDTLEEAIFNAQQVLDILLLEMTTDNHDISLPSTQKQNEVLITASPEVAVPVLLHTLRKQKDYSLTDVARIMGTSYQTYQQIESGKNITLKSLKKAAAALGATVDIRLVIPPASNPSDTQ